MSTDTKWKMSESVPSAKVLAATLAAFLAPLVFRLLARLFTGNEALPDGFETVVRELIEAAVISGATFAAGYQTRPRPADKIVVDPKA